MKIVMCTSRSFRMMMCTTNCTSGRTCKERRSKSSKSTVQQHHIPSTCFFSRSDICNTCSCCRRAAMVHKITIPCLISLAEMYVCATLRKTIICVAVAVAVALTVFVAAAVAAFGLYFHSHHDRQDHTRYVAWQLECCQH